MGKKEIRCIYKTLHCRHDIRFSFVLHNYIQCRYHNLHDLRYEFNCPESHSLDWISKEWAGVLFIFLSSQFHSIMITCYNFTEHKLLTSSNNYNNFYC